MDDFTLNTLFLTVFGVVLSSGWNSKQSVDCSGNISSYSPNLKFISAEVWAGNESVVTIIVKLQSKSHLDLEVEIQFRFEFEAHLELLLKELVFMIWVFADFVHTNTKL